MLVLLKGEHEVAQDGLKVGGKLGTCILFKSRKRTASSFLDALVVVENHTKKLRALLVDSLDLNQHVNTYTLQSGDEELVLVLLRDRLGAPAGVPP